MRVRKATLDDKDAIQQILKLSFGHCDDSYFDVRGNNYVVAECDGKVVAVTGVVDNDYCNYSNAYEVSWTATHPAYRHRGIMPKLLRYAIETRDDKNKCVYCSCWRVGDSDINLIRSMKELGFTLVYKARTHYVSPYYHVCQGCVCNTGAPCECYEDLYILQAGR